MASNCLLCVLLSFLLGIDIVTKAINISAHNTALATHSNFSSQHSSAVDNTILKSNDGEREESEDYYYDDLQESFSLPPSLENTSIELTTTAQHISSGLENTSFHLEPDSFQNESTTDYPMQQSDQGWIIIFLLSQTTDLFFGGYNFSKSILSSSTQILERAFFAFIIIKLETFNFNGYIAPLHYFSFHDC